MKDYSDKELFISVGEGSEAAFKELYDRYLPPLVPFLCKLTGGNLQADEVLQETFMRIWLHRDRLADVEFPRTWLFQVAANATFSWLRKQVRYQQALGRMAQNTEEIDLLQQSAEAQIQLAETQRLVREAVDKLPTKRRRIYQLSREQGLTIPEIAAALRVSPNTVKNALVKALSFIRETLRKSGYMLPQWLWVLLPGISERL